MWLKTVYKLVKIPKLQNIIQYVQVVHCKEKIKFFVAALARD